MRESSKVLYLDAVSQILNEGHMLIKHRLQTEDSLSSERKIKERSKTWYKSHRFVVHITGNTLYMLITQTAQVLDLHKNEICDC